MPVRARARVQRDEGEEEGEERSVGATRASSRRVRRACASPVSLCSEPLSVDEPTFAQEDADRALYAASAYAAAGAPHDTRTHFPSLDRQAVAERQVIHEPPDPSTLRFLFATDNHVGYYENDSIRQHDSYLSFEECLLIAQLNQVDFILLGGDLFHENKPSRPCLYRVMNLLRDYCLGDRPIHFDILSDQQLNFPSTGCANFHDPNTNVSLPIFIIHGNHDDPSGLGSFSAIDLLASCRLLNYFGKSERVDDITNHPILLEKDATRVALYGLGNIRDERLHRTFAAGGVKWARASTTRLNEKPEMQSNRNVDPGEQADNRWFNVAVLHQNRVPHSFVDKNFIGEAMLPKFLDLVFWAHEHECLMQEESEKGGFALVQPGSSIATSLSPAEAKEKKVAIIEIRGDEFRVIPVPLGTVRPFVIEDIKLRDELETGTVNVAAAVEDCLTVKVEDMIKAVKDNPKFQNRDRPSLPLIRLRVEHTGFSRINVTKFGQKFVQRVANPDEILQFFKQSKVVRKNKADSVQVQDVVDELAPQESVQAQPIQVILKALVSRYPLSVLPEMKFSDAVEEFVEKKNLSAISDFVDHSLKHAQKSVRDEMLVKERGEKLNNEDIQKLLRKHHELLLAQEDASISSMQAKLEQQEQENVILEEIDLNAVDRLAQTKTTKTAALEADKHTASRASRNKGHQKLKQEDDDEEQDAHDDDEICSMDSKSKKLAHAKAMSYRSQRTATTTTTPRSRKLKLELTANNDDEDHHSSNDSHDDEDDGLAPMSEDSSDSWSRSRTKKDSFKTKLHHGSKKEDVEKEDVVKPARKKTKVKADDEALSSLTGKRGTLPFLLGPPNKNAVKGKAASAKRVSAKASFKGVRDMVEIE